MGPAAHPACAPLCPQTLLGARGCAWVISALRNDTALLQLFLAKGGMELMSLLQQGSLSTDLVLTSSCDGVPSV